MSLTFDQLPLAQLMKLQQRLEALPAAQKAQLKTLQDTHGLRVRRALAMALLDIDDERTFKKVVDANPGLAHRIPGERQDKYVTAVIYLLRPDSRCATCGEETKK